MLRPLDENRIKISKPLNREKQQAKQIQQKEMKKENVMCCY